MKMTGVLYQSLLGFIYNVLQNVNMLSRGLGA